MRQPNTLQSSGRAAEGRALFARDRAVEAWLQTEVAAAYDAAVADSTRAISAKSVRNRLAEEQAVLAHQPRSAPGRHGFPQYVVALTS